MKPPSAVLFRLCINGAEWRFNRVEVKRVCTSPTIPGDRWREKRYKSITTSLMLEHFELSEPSNSSGMTQSDSRVAARKNAYRKASAALGLIGAGLALAALPYVYFLLLPVLSISAILMIAGSVLIWTRNAIRGALLVFVGGLFGGFLGVPWLLWTLLAIAFGDWVYGLPLLPLGVLVPIASLVLAFMSREPSKAKVPQS